MLYLRFLTLSVFLVLTLPCVAIAQDDTIIESEPLEPPGNSIGSTSRNTVEETDEVAPEDAAQEDVAEEEPLTELPDMSAMENMKYVSLRTVDKLSARTHTFDIPVEKAVKFGKSLFIKARACRSASPLSQPENAAFLQIWERKPEEDKPKWVFSGWIFSSNPSLSAMDHPVYDVWVIACKNSLTSKTSAAAVKKPAAPPKETEPVVASEPTPVADTPKVETETDTPPAEDKPATPPKLEDMPSSFEDSE